MSYFKPNQQICESVRNPKIPHSFFSEILRFFSHIAPQTSKLLAQLTSQHLLPLKLASVPGIQKLSGNSSSNKQYEARWRVRATANVALPRPGLRAGESV